MPAEETQAGGRLIEIVSAAQRCLARDGYANSSIKDIAHEAGVAPGLIHYYFDSKEDLLIAAVRETAVRYRGEFFGQLRNYTNPRAGLTNAIEWAGRKLKEDPAWFLLIMELYNLSLHDEKVRVELISMLREERALVTEAVSAILATTPEQLGVSAELLGTLILAVFDGVIIHTLIDPTVDPIENLSAAARAVTALLPS
jgi:AcrR family transcriptional regulator